MGRWPGTGTVVTAQTRQPCCQVSSSQFLVLAVLFPKVGIKLAPHKVVRIEKELNSGKLLEYYLAGNKFYVSFRYREFFF